MITHVLELFTILHSNIFSFSSNIPSIPRDIPLALIIPFTYQNPLYITPIVQSIKTILSHSIDCGGRVSLCTHRVSIIIMK